MKSVKIDVIPSNTEKFLSFSIGALRFIDSYQFLSASLDDLVKCLAKDDMDKFSYTKQQFPNSSLVFEKRVYCYEYCTGPEVFEETQLPPIEKFYSALNEEAVAYLGWGRWCDRPPWVTRQFFFNVFILRFSVNVY